MNKNIVSYEISIQKMYGYIWQSSYEIIGKHIILDAIQDSLIVMALNQLMKIGLTEEQISTVTTHVCSSCDIKTMLLSFSPTSAKARKSPDTVTQTPSSLALAESPVWCSPCSEAKSKTPKKDKDLPKLNLFGDLEEEAKSLKKTKQIVPKKRNSLTPIDTTDVKQTEKQKVINDNSPFNDFVQDFAMHVGVKLIATLIFPPVHYFSGKHAGWVSQSTIWKVTENMIKFAGINPLEGLIAIDTITSVATFNQIAHIPGLKQINDDYIETRQDDAEYECFMKAYYLWMESIDGLMHGRDNIKVLVDNIAQPYVGVKAALMLAAGIALKINTDAAEARIDEEVANRRMELSGLIEEHALISSTSQLDLAIN